MITIYRKQCEYRLGIGVAFVSAVWLILRPSKIKKVMMLLNPVKIRKLQYSVPVG